MASRQKLGIIQIQKLKLSDNVFPNWHLFLGEKICLILYVYHGNLTTHIIVASAIHLTIISKINHEETLTEEHVDNAIPESNDEKRA